MGTAAVFDLRAAESTGEEAYSVVLVWQLKSDQEGVRLRLLATDRDSELLERARGGCYGTSSLVDLPAGWRRRAFVTDGDRYRIKSVHRCPVEFMQHDIRGDPPSGQFDLILCRNLAFTYFCDELQAEVLAGFSRVLSPEGILLVGSHERLPASAHGYVALDGPRGFYRNVAS